jgi:hypothetical protein
MYSVWPTDTRSPKDLQTEEQNADYPIFSGSSRITPGSAMPVLKRRQPRRHPVQPRVDRPTGRENDVSREALRTTILEIVDSQIRNHDPPEALATYDRLIGQGHSDEEARRLIGCVVASEVVGIVNESREYDHRRYLAALEALPRLA